MAFVFNNQTLLEQLFLMGIDQGSALSPILSDLYIAPAIHTTSSLYYTVLLESHSVQQPIVTVKGETYINEVIQFFINNISF